MPASMIPCYLLALVALELYTSLFMPWIYITCRYHRWNTINHGCFMLTALFLVLIFQSCDTQCTDTKYVVNTLFTGRILWPIWASLESLTVAGDARNCCQYRWSCWWTYWSSTLGAWTQGQLLSTFTKIKVVLLLYDCMLEWYQMNFGWQTWQDCGRQLIGAFAAASNVTGALVDVDAVSALLHRYHALALWDYATAAPHIKIDMNPVRPW